MFHFPPNPAVAQEYNPVPGIVFRWNGSAWYLINTSPVLTKSEADVLYIALGQRGAADGVATLDAGVKIPVAQIPDEVALDSEVAAAIAAHEAAADPHPAYLTAADADAAYEPAGTMAAHIAAGDPHPTYLTAAEGNAAYEALGAVAAHAAAADPHVGYQKESEKGANNGYPSLDAGGFIPIGQIPTSLLSEAEALALYVPLTQRGVANGVASLDAGGTVPDAQLPAGLARDTEVTAAVAAHAAAANPHPVYLTQAEGDAAYEVAGAVAAHAGAADPHTGYQRESEKGLANGYASLDAGGTVPDAQLPAGLARDAEVTAAIAAHAAAGDPHPGYLTAAEGNAAYIPLTQRGAINGVATLDAAGTIPDAQIPAAVARDAEVTAAITAHAALADPHTGYQKESEKDAASGYPGLDANTRLVLARLPLAGSDGQFLVRRTGAMAYATLLDADIPATIARDSEVTAAVAAHAAAPDAHPEYLTPAEGAAAYEPLGAVAAHAGAPDPHPGYLTSAEGNAAYEAAGAVAAHAAAADPHAGYQKESEKDAANGYPGLDANTRLVLARLPLASADGQFLVRRSGLTSYATLVDADVPATIARDTEVTAAIAAHEAAANPHPTYLTAAEGNAAYEALGAVAAHAAAADPHPTYLTAAEGAAAYEALGAVAAHAAAADPHVGYQKESERGAVNGYASLDAGGTVPDAQIPAAIARDTEVTSAIAAHAALADPHPGYLTAAEGNAAYIPLSQRAAANGVATLDASSLIPDAQIPATIARDTEITSAISTHAAAADPHTVYQKESEKAVANGYASLDATGKVPSAQLPAAASTDDSIIYAIALG